MLSIFAEARALRTVTKVALVMGGCIVALVVASALAALYVTVTEGPDRQTYGAMYAFGDGIFFLGVFAVAAIAPTGAALFFLRSQPAFWRGLAAVSKGLAATALGACLVYFASKNPAIGFLLQPWSDVAVLRLLIAPALGLAFLLAGILAPNRESRVSLLRATGMELGSCGCVVLSWVYATLTH